MLCCGYWWYGLQINIFLFIQKIRVHSPQFDIQIKRFKRFERFEFYMSQQIYSQSKKGSQKNPFSVLGNICLCHRTQNFRVTTLTFQNCLLKRVILYKKQHFRVFESSNIRNENKQMNQSHFLSCETYLSIESYIIYRGIYI